ncbi:hypothetical protein [Psychromonas sp. MME2]|uniref:hypothetical protein n=1 Tax=unclassified Psychromonas TaxID=2614957 RepID=UPI00339D128D
MDNAIESKLDELFVLTQQLNACLNENNIDEFQLLEKHFSSKMYSLLDTQTQQALQDFLPQLAKLEALLQQLQIVASQKQTMLKEQALSLKRNKGKLNAYKKNVYK